ncbi:MAG: hypothetical protein Q4D32_09665 [Eubacteriales bacterium]|nr:hypothetical protein [Eubacteriales bacterium]
MKQGYMIYTEAEGKKNQAFIEMFQRAGEVHDLLFSFVSIEEYPTKPLPDLVLNRTRDPRVSWWYESHRIPVYHDSDITTVGNDKYQTLQVLQRRLPDAIRETPWCPASFLITQKQKTYLPLLREQIRESLGDVDTVVLKTVDGHGGSEVFRLPADPVGEETIWKQTLAELSGRKLLCQAWIDSGGQDLRVYILWGEIYAAVLRQGGADFRSNYSLGGQVQPYLLSGREKSYISQFVQALGGRRLAMAGVDFLLSGDGALVFNELEEMAGSRMLYQCTSFDIVRDFVSILKKRM